MLCRCSAAIDTPPSNVAARASRSSSSQSSVSHWPTTHFTNSPTCSNRIACGTGRTAGHSGSTSSCTEGPRPSARPGRRDRRTTAPPTRRSRYSDTLMPCRDQMRVADAPCSNAPLAAANELTCLRRSSRCRCSSHRPELQSSPHSRSRTSSRRRLPRPPRESRTASPRCSRPCRRA